MKAKLFFIFLIGIFLSFSVYAGCCSMTNAQGKCNYWDFGDWNLGQEFCSKVSVFFDLSHSWDPIDCSGFDTIPDCHDGWTATGEDLILPSTVTPSRGIFGGSGTQNAAYFLSLLNRNQSQECTQLAYKCDDWTDCKDNRQTRECTQQQMCNGVSSTKKVEETKSCGEKITESGGTSDDVIGTETGAGDEESESVPGMEQITGGAVTDTEAEPNNKVAILVIVGLVLLGILGFTYFRKSKK